MPNCLMKATSAAPVQVEELFGQAPSAAARQTLEALRQAVGQALDRKRRLGQFAVIWEAGEVRRLPPEALPTWPASTGTAYGQPPLSHAVAASEPRPAEPTPSENPPPQAPDRR